MFVGIELIIRRGIAFDDGGIRRLDQCLWRNINPWFLNRNKRFLNRRFQQSSPQIDFGVCIYWNRSALCLVPRHIILDFEWGAYLSADSWVFTRSSFMTLFRISLAYVFINWTLVDSRLYLQAVLRQNVAFFDRLGAGEVTNRVSNDAELIREGISDKVRTPHPSPEFPSQRLTNSSHLSLPVPSYSR